MTGTAPDSAPLGDGGTIPPAPGRASGRLRRFVRRRRHWSLRLSLHGLGLFAEIVAGLLLVAGLGVGFLVWQLSQGPIAYEGLNRLLASGIESRLPKGYSVSVRTAEIGQIVNGLRLGIGGFAVRDDTGRTVLATPRAEIGFDGLSLLIGRIVPRDIDLSGLLLAVTIRPDGTVAISEETTETAQAPANPEPQPPSPHAGSAAPSPLAIGAFIDALSNHSGPLGVLARASLRDGILRIDDQRRSRSVRYGDLVLEYDRSDDGHMHLAIGARGEHGRWQASGTLDGRAGEARHLALEAQDIAVSELLGFAERGSVPVRTDMPLSLRVAIDVDGASALTGLTGAITGGRTTLILDDPKAPPIRVDGVSGEFALAPDRSHVAIPLISFSSGAAQWRISGDVKVPSTAEDGWAFTFQSQGATLVGDGTTSKPVRINAFELAGAVEPGFSGVRIDRLKARGADYAFTGSAAIGRVSTRDGLVVSLDADNASALSLLAFWPSFVIPEVRSYLGTAIEGGLITSAHYRLDLDPEGLSSVVANGPVKDSAVAVDLAFRDGTMLIDKGLPRIKGLDGTVHVTGKRVLVSLASGQIESAGDRTLSLPVGSYRVDNVDEVPAKADVNFRFQGAAEDFAVLMRADMLKSVAAPTLDPLSTSGDVDMTVKLHFPLQPDLKPSDIQLSAEGMFKSLSVANAFGHERLEGGSVRIAADATGLFLAGDGRIGGAPAQFEMRQPAGTTRRDASVMLTLDDAARERKGMRTASQLQGPVTMKLDIKAGEDGKVRGKGELDLSKATIAGLIPGWTRAPGKPLKATFQFTALPDESVRIDTLTLDDLSISLKGEAEFAPDGQIRSITLPQLRVSSGDKVSAAIERTASGYHVTIQGDQLDGRALMRNLTAPAGGGAASGQDLDVDLKLGTIIGFNNETMKAADLHVEIRSGFVKDLRLDGQIARQPIFAQAARNDNNAPVIVIQSADGGALLRFLDIYKRMNAGTLSFQFSTGGPPIEGQLTIRRFAILDEAALATLNAQPGIPSGRAIITDPKNVSFNRLNAPFTIAQGKISVRDGVISGPALGGTVEGMIDYAHGTIDLKGTVVPAYLINNLFNKLPIIGQLLGGENEGVFSVNYRASGALASPQVTFNPLSAVAPGFLRRLFEVSGPKDGGAPPEPPPAAIPTP